MLLRPSLLGIILMCLISFGESNFNNTTCPNRNRTIGYDVSQTRLNWRSPLIQEHQERGWTNCEEKEPAKNPGDKVEFQFDYSNRRIAKTKNKPVKKAYMEPSSVEEILNLISWGEELIELSDNKDILLLVGMSGSGKSTLAQFVAGQKNQLEAIEDGRKFIVKDHCGSVSNSSLISKTLLPELTISEDQSAFYDCPGFSDTRNTSVEIANAFFIKKVADHAERVKIVVVVTESTMSTDDRDAFLDLLRQLVVLIRDVDKLYDGISLLVTKAYLPHPYNDGHAFIDYKKFFEILKNELADVWKGPDLDRAFRIVDAFSEEDVNGNFTKLGLFRSPNSVGFLDELDIFQCNKENLINLLWNNIDYVEKNNTDFGYGLSSDALLLIVSLVETIDKSITDSLTSFSLTLYNHFSSQLSKLFDDGTIDPELRDNLFALKEANYPLCENQPNLPVLDYITEIVNNIEKYSPENFKEITLYLKRQGDLLIFLDNASENKTSIRPNQWIRSLLDLKVMVNDHIEIIVEKIDISIKDNLTDFQLNLNEHFSDKLNELPEGETINLELKENLFALKEAKYLLCESVPNLTAPVYITEIVDNIDKFSPGVFKEIISYLRRQEELLVFLANSTDYQTKFRPSEWVRPLNDLKVLVYAHIDIIIEVIDQSIKNTLASFGLSLNINFSEKLNEVLEDDTINPVLRENLIALREAKYPLCESVSNLTAVVYITEIVNNIDDFSPDYFKDIILYLKIQEDFLVFLQSSTINSIRINPAEWSRPLNNLKISVFEYINKDFSNNLFNVSYQTLSNISTVVSNNILSELSNNSVSVHERLNISTGLSTTLSTLFNQLETKLTENGLDASNYFQYVVDTLPYSIPKYYTQDSIEAISSMIQYLEFLEYLTSPDWIKAEEWLEPFEDLKVLAEGEFYWLNNFIIWLFNGLSKIEVQIDEQKLLQTWWMNNKPFTSNKFSDFWSKFSGLEGMSLVEKHTVENLCENPQKLDTLDSVLQLTLEDDYNCTKFDNVTVCKGKYLSMKRIYNDIEVQNSGIQTLAILGSHTVFLDTDIMGSAINQENYVNIFAISPSFISKDSVVDIDLSGILTAYSEHELNWENKTTFDGRTGVGGKKAGDAYFVGQNYKGTLNFILKGGRGGKGLLGSTGSEGSKGGVKHFSESSDCAAWSGGDIEVRILPHRCGGNTYVTLPARCYADDDGVYVEIFGHTGAQGGKGGQGTRGGQGGLGGYSMVVNVQESNPTNLQGPGGDGGPGGNGGSGGQGGLNGETNQLYVDDMTCGANKCCKIVRDAGWGVVSGRGPTGPPGDQGELGPKGPTQDPKTIIPPEYAQYVQNYKTELENLLNNEFFMTPLSVFLGHVNNHNSIPK